MRAEDKARSPSCTSGPGLWTFLFALLMVLLHFTGPAAAIAPSVGGSVADGLSDPAGSTSLHDSGTGHPLVTGAADPAIRVRPAPTPAPVKQNRTPSLPIVGKNIAERPKVTLPATWFIVIVAVAFIGLCAILYLLLRRGAGTPAGRGKRGKEPAGHATVIDVQEKKRAGRIPPGVPGTGCAVPPVAGETVP